MGFYGGGGRVLDVSGELRGDLYRQRREIARLWTGDPQGFRPNIPFTWVRANMVIISFSTISIVVSGLPNLASRRRKDRGARQGNK
jgi:hypothetical protein